MVTKLASITYSNAYTLTAIESISMTLGHESMKVLCGGVILFARASSLAMVLLGGLKRRS